MPKTNSNPGSNEEHYLKIEDAWATIALNESFGKMTFAQFQARLAASKEKRARIAALENELKNLISERDDDDMEAMKACDEVVKGVVGDPDYGDDCGLYSAMGYIRKSERKSGLTRKKNLASNIKKE